MFLRPKTPLFDGFPAVVSVLSDITLCFYVVDTEDVKNGKGPSPARGFEIIERKTSDRRGREKMGETGEGEGRGDLVEEEKRRGGWNWKRDEETHRRLLLPSFTLVNNHDAPRVPTEEASTMIPTLNRYWRLFNDPGLAPLDPILSPIMPGLGPPGVTTKAFLGLTQQVRTLTGMIQSIVPYIPQLAQAPTHQHPYIPRQTMQQEAPQSRSSQGERLRGSAPHPRSKPRSRSLSESTAKPLSRCYASPARAGCCFLRLYQLGEGTTSPSQPDARRGRAQMALYDIDALMFRTFHMTLRGPTRIWYNQIKSSSISSFDQFAKEFELNFIASSCPRPTAASLLSLTQGSDEPLAQFVSRFSTEIRRMPDIHPTMAIQAFLIGLRPSRFF
ncbi:hypothetical protein B296_00015275 [Ensete ventricosum]|uniref:Retrotransposon gag domain-containing protein n=1 Tax=Ensete ventricosum TaxID=4639 RepID=A0A427AXY4_ENSVE|nr:hypothetical protein B296_00015275 [Ensete ventricosum]